jgi:predicted GNAT family acetyltransferase
MALEEERRGLFAATVEDDGEIIAAAIRTDFPKMVLAAAGKDDHLIELARLVHPHMPDLPCVVGPENQVVAFAAEWGRLNGAAGRLGMPQRIHALRTVKPNRDVQGEMRPAEKADLDLVLDWFGAFEMEAIHAAGRSKEARRQTLVERGIESGAFLVWLDQGPVSMAGAREFGEGVARVGPVYTPPEFRRTGYGGALTAAVSQRMLDQGCSACCLFTDLTNPTSNHIYAEIGYLPKADFKEFWFGGG